MITALPLFAYAIANDVDTDHARDAYDAIVRGLPGGPAGILDALADIGMVPGTLQDELRGAEREVEELSEELVGAREELDAAEEIIDGQKIDIDNQKHEIESERKRVASRDDTIAVLTDKIAELREEIAQLSA